MSTDPTTQTVDQAHSSSDGFEAVVQRLLPRLRSAFRKAKIIVRLDGGFAVPAVLDFLEAHDRGYVVGMQATSALASVAAAAMNAARDQAILTEASARSYGETLYQTQSWDDDRRVVYEAEVVCLDGREPRDNLRCVVTHLTSSPARIFDLYRGRGDMENRIRELKCRLQIDHTSCSSSRSGSSGPCDASSCISLPRFPAKKRGTSSLGDWGRRRRSSFSWESSDDREPLFGAHVRTQQAIAPLSTSM